MSSSAASRLTNQSEHAVLSVVGAPMVIIKCENLEFVHLDTQLLCKV
jgi:hypothetical protein